jgi:hypothetical protein
MRFTLYAADGSSVDTEAIGEAMDSGDKGMNKAMSYAYKYAMLQLLCIPTEAIDGDVETHPPTSSVKATEYVVPDAPKPDVPKQWPATPSKPAKWTDKEVELFMERADGAPWGQLEVIERELNGAQTSKLIDAKDANSIRRSLLTRLISECPKDRLSSLKVLLRIPGYASGRLAMEDCNTLIAMFNERVNSATVGE